MSETKIFIALAIAIVGITGIVSFAHADEGTGTVIETPAEAPTSPVATSSDPTATSTATSTEDTATSVVGGTQGTCLNCDVLEAQRVAKHEARVQVADLLEQLKALDPALYEVIEIIIR